METSDRFIRIRESRGGFDVSIILLGWSRPQVGQTVWAENLTAAHDAAIKLRRDQDLDCDIYCEMGRS